MLSAQLLIACVVVLAVIVTASFVDEEEMSFVQLTVQKNWKRGKAKEPTQNAPTEEFEDDISFMQTKVAAEHRIKPAYHSHEVHHMIGGVTPDGDVAVVEEGITEHTDRPPLSIEDAFSLMQTTAEVDRRASLDLFPDDGVEVSLLQTGLVVNRDVAPKNNLATEQSLPEQTAGSRSWVEAATSVLMASPSSAVAAAVGLKASREAGLPAASPQPAAAKGTGVVWLDHAIEKLTVKSWELREWVFFIICLLVLECVVWKATQTKALNLKEIKMPRSWRKAKAPAPPKRLSLTLPLRQLLNRSGGSVKLFGSSDGHAFVATLLEDASGDRTVQIADAADPTQALMSVGPLPQSGLLEEGAAVHRYSTGYTIGALRLDGPGFWSLSKNGHTSLFVSSSAPFTLALSMCGRELEEVAWVKPLSEGKEPDYVDFSICEGGDPVLPVACALAVLIASSSSSEEQDQTQQ